MNKKGFNPSLLKLFGILQLAGGAIMIAKQYNLYPVPEIPFMGIPLAAIMLFMSLFTIKDAPDMRLPI